MMLRTITTRTLTKGAAALVGWLVLLSACSSSFIVPEFGRTGEIPVVTESQPLPVSTVPTGEEVLREPSDPEAEPLIRVWTTFTDPPILAACFVAQTPCPGFPTVLEKPPRG
jgi:hypothetical protein